MKRFRWLASIRARLVAAYMGILVLAFAAFALVAGGQISSAARQDYEQRLVNEMRLIAQGVSSYAVGGVGVPASDALRRLIADYEVQVGGRLTLLFIPSIERRGMLMFPMLPEIETALRGSAAVVQRPNDDGRDALFTAAVVGDVRRSGLVAHLSVPLDNLQALIVERWAALGLVFALVTAAALGAALAMSRSIIHPLVILRQSAVRLSQGDLAHRVPYTAYDEIGEVARAFNEMAQQVENMLNEQRAFASNTSHELRTPLTTIRLRTEALRSDPNLDAATVRRYIAEVDDEVMRLGGLVEDLALLSRFDAGRAELGDTEIDLGRFVNSLVQQLQHLARTRGLRLEWIVPTDAPVVSASLNHLMVVFRNLLDNAIKYTPEGGKVIIELSAHEAGAQVVIRDTGRGIEPEHVLHVFERFYRADRARSRDIPGTGLGLALVKSIVEAYGGSITIYSEGAGKGTIVTVVWPQRPGC